MQNACHATVLSRTASSQDRGSAERQILLVLPAEVPAEIASTPRTTLAQEEIIMALREGRVRVAV